MPPQQKKQFNKNVKGNNNRNPTPKIYGYFLRLEDSVADDNYYLDVIDLIKDDLVEMYPSYIKSVRINNHLKNGEETGSVSIYLNEASKDMTMEQFNHFVRIVNKNQSILPSLKLYFVSTNEKGGAKYTYSNYVKSNENVKIPNIFTFCETADININNLKQQLQNNLKEAYMDLYAVKNKSKNEYNLQGGYFIKLRLNAEIDEVKFKLVSETIRAYFSDNYQEDNLKLFYKTDKEENGKKYSFTFPPSNINNKPSFIEEV